MQTLEREVRLLATPAQAERAPGISRKTLDRLVEEGVLTVVRLHGRGHRRFRWRDLNQLAEEEDHA
jgi:excisionase family DNA binding protein